MMSHWHPTLQDTRYKDEPLAWYNTQVQGRPERGECAVVERSHLHTTHRESFTPTTDKLQSLHQPEGHSRPWAIAGELREARFILRNPSQHRPRTLLWRHCFSVDGNWLQPTWTQLWLQLDKHLWPTLGPRHDRQPLSARAPSQDHPCVGTVGEDVMGSTPSDPCLAGAK